MNQSIVKFKGRSFLKQYMPKKTIKRGYKIWMRWDQSDFACQFQIYAGKINDNVQKKLRWKGRLRTDWSFESSNFLKSKKFLLVVLLFQIEKNFLKIFSTDKSLQWGEFDWAVINENVLCFKWRDRGTKKEVHYHPFHSRRWNSSFRCVTQRKRWNNPASSLYTIQYYIQQKYGICGLF